MAKDPAFLFYPGDYLRDTQCLSEQAQVAYDRIMCEHMRNICITQDRLNFFTKRLTPDQKIEVETVLQKIPGGYQIDWVAESIGKRKNYSDSRRKNRSSSKKDISIISKTYDTHMENAIENVNGIDSKIKKESVSEIDPAAAFDEIFLEALKTSGAYPGVDIDQELKRFILKVQGSPRVYADHDNAGLRLAFSWQLRAVKPSSGKPIKKQKAFNLNEI